MKIALLQIAPCKTLEENLEKGISACRKAKESGADLALFPEMWSNGYNIYDRPVEEWKKEAIPVQSDFISTFGGLARELELAIGITLLEKYKNAPRNSLVLFDRFGEQKFVYAKVHTCDFSVEYNLTPGEDFYVTTLDTACGEVKVGAMICYDREFPESARILMLKGAELILVPNACPMEINRLSQLRARAYENMTAIATCNYPETVPDCNGGSSVFDGVAYLPELDNSRDTCILQADGQEGIYTAELDLEQLRNYRKKEVHGNTWRRPTKYGLLTDTKIQEPFVRNDYRFPVTIRNEVKSDFREVEELTRKAFCNVNVPGCDEHYLAHVLREHEDFIPELDLVAETVDGKIVGSVMYTRAKLIDENGVELPILTFGPISVHPDYQRMGISRKLLELSFHKAIELGYKAIVIFGNPDNYVSRGFKSCRKYNVCTADGGYPAAMLVKELMPGTFDGIKWFYHESPAYEYERADAEKFDEEFELMEKKWRPSQEEFYIHSHSTVRD